MPQCTDPSPETEAEKAQMAHIRGMISELSELGYVTMSAQDIERSARGGCDLIDYLLDAARIISGALETISEDEPDTSRIAVEKASVKIRQFLDALEYKKAILLDLRPPMPENVLPIRPWQ